MHVVEPTTGLSLRRAEITVGRILSRRTRWAGQRRQHVRPALPRVTGRQLVGFYFVRGDEVVLGPFQGKVACVRIALGRGVCGTAAQRRETLVVPDVHAFPGHIACDAASRSEM